MTIEEESEILGYSCRAPKVEKPLEYRPNNNLWKDETHGKSKPTIREPEEKFGTMLNLGKFTKYIEGCHPYLEATFKTIVEDHIFSKYIKDKRSYEN